MRPAVVTAVGATAQAALLAGLAGGGLLGAPGALAGAACAAVTPGLLGAALHRAERSAGPADVVTLGRAVLTGGVAALVVDGLVTGSTAVGTLTGLAAAALVLDGVDGQVARRTGTASPLGARFDMEVDAFLILALSVHVAAALGPWVLAIGLMRYAFVAAGWLLPWLTGPLPPSRAAKTVAALQGVVLVVAGSGLVSPAVATGLVATALLLLSWSFARSIRHLRALRS